MEAKAPWGSVYLLAMDEGQGGLAGHLNARQIGGSTPNKVMVSS